MIEQLYYMEFSRCDASGIILQPEVTKRPTFIEASLLDPALVVESFYRIYRTVKIRTGRRPLTERGHSKFIVYDPIISVNDSDVAFEAFSYDMTHYAALTLNKSAFKNVKKWELGQTNVYFSPEFINKLREAEPSRIKSLKIDPEGFSVNLEKNSLKEKKIELPENWRIGLENLRESKKQDAGVPVLKQPEAALYDTPFKPFVNRFAKVIRGWVPREGWKFVELSLRSGLGTVIVGLTAEPTARFDGRQNPRYQAIRQQETLRQLKSYLMQVETRHSDVWEVTSGESKHIVKKQGRAFTCDCKDSRYGSQACKHICAVKKPKVRITLLENDKWRIITLAGDDLERNVVEFQGMKFTCTCMEYKETYICQHIIDVLQSERDFQFDELVRDLVTKKS